MSDPTQQQTADDLFDQACEWVVRLRAEDIADSDLEQFANWVAHSDQHRCTFEQVTEMWGDLGVADSLPVQTATAQQPIPVPSRSANQSPSRFTNLFRWQTMGGLTAAATVVAVALLTLLPSAPELYIYRTAIGEQLHVTLPDGSQVELNTNTVLEVGFEDDQRWLHLIKGEAYFSVAKDQSRPFIVELDGAQAKAVGTEFNIYRSTDSLAEITVTEGTVMVTDKNNPSLPKILEVDQAVSYDTRKGLNDIRTDAKANTITAWRQHQIVFENIPLKEVISTLNRYSQTTIELASSDFAQMSISGTFSTERPIETARAVAEVLALEISTVDNRFQLVKPTNTPTDTPTS